jgi:hypothetical protein
LIFSRVSNKCVEESFQEDFEFSSTNSLHGDRR